MNRRLLALLVIVLVLLLGLGALYFYLTGSEQQANNAPRPAETGVVSIRTIYTADGENLLKPVGIGADDNGGFFITLRDVQRVLEFDSNGDFVRKWGERGLEGGQMMVPLGVAVDRLAGNVYVTDRSRLRLIAYDLEGTYRWEVTVLNPLTPVVTADGVAVLTFGPIPVFDPEGQLLREVGSRGHDSGQFDYPRAAALLENGDLAVADTNNARIQRVNMSGEVTAAAVWVNGEPPRFQDDPETSFGVPAGIALDDKGRLFVIDGFRHQIKVLDQETGDVLHVFDDLQGEADGQFYLPTGIAFLGDSTFAVTDTFNDRVQIIRLLLPGENNVVARSPWLLWLLLLPLLALLFLFGRRRDYVTSEALERAAGDSQLRLLAGVYKKLHVLPEVHERFAGVREGDVAIGEYLQPVDAPSAESDLERALAQAATPVGLARLLLPRRLFVVADSAQAERIKAVGHGRVVCYDEVVERYALRGDAVATPADASAAGVSDEGTESSER